MTQNNERLHSEREYRDAIRSMRPSTVSLAEECSVAAGMDREAELNDRLIQRTMTYESKDANQVMRIARLESALTAIAAVATLYADGTSDSCPQDRAMNEILGLANNVLA